MKKIYLGDSVYAQKDGYGVILTTEKGHPDDPSNAIFLEPEVIASLILFAKKEGVIKEGVTEGSYTGGLMEMKAMDTQAAFLELSQINDKLLDAVQKAYRKHHLWDNSIGWSEVSSILRHALCEAMTDDGFQKWLKSLKR